MTRLVAAILALGFAFGASYANATEMFLIHAKTSLKIDDAQICAVPNVAWAALQK